MMPSADEAVALQRAPMVGVVAAVSWWTSTQERREAEAAAVLARLDALN
jgi:hypothetical protein